MPKPARASLAERFFKYVAKNGIDECWPWQAAIRPDGYGSLGKVGGGTMLAHRASWQILNGPIPDGLMIDHLCRNRACVNPKHLRLCTNLENMYAPGSLALGAVNRAKTHCKNGHSLENAYIWFYKGNPQRRCRICRDTRNKIQSHLISERRRLIREQKLNHV